MLRFGRGDGAAFEALYLRHERRIFRYLRRNLNDETAANDLMQEVWFAVARNAQNYQPSAKFTTWLFTIAHHRLIDAHRKSRPMERLDTTDATGDEEDYVNIPAADPALEPPAVLESQDEAMALLKAVEALPSEQRTAFMLQADGELSVEEIAGATGATFETVKSRLRYARAKLRQTLWEFA
jgi:RNA polymerase sigma factor (sigma-70 family)